MTEKQNNIRSVMKESRLFPPPADFSKGAKIKSIEEYEQIYKRSISDPIGFWEEMGRQHLDWSTPFTKVLDWQLPFAKWFEDGHLNASFNCLDRHRNLEKLALIWEGEPGERRTFTYQQLLDEVCRFANGLKTLGYKQGDVATIYMPMIPELTIAMLACSRLGIVLNVVFAGFSADSITDRNENCGASLVITADGGWRRGQVLELKECVDRAIESNLKVKHVIVVKRTAQQISMKQGRDLWWDRLIADQTSNCDPVSLPAEHPLFLLYTSGSTGKPKGILHTTAGYLLSVMLSFQCALDHRADDVYWCTADIGWITGHSYIVYGPLLNGATVFMYEGAPNFPDFSRFWQIIEREKISIFYTAPTAIRAFMKAGRELPDRHDLSSLRLLGTVGEPINPEAWMWYREVIGKSRCPIIDTWWQTETGSIMITPLPGATPTIPGTATRPFFGIDVDVVDKQGKSVATNEGGYLVIRQPWPSMLRNIYGDPERFRKTYWEQIPGLYFTGDGARRDEHGYIWIMGRIDDVLNVSGHRLSTMELESTLVGHPAVAEAAVVGFPHDVKGEGIHAFVSLRRGFQSSESVISDLKKYVSDHIGAIARPDVVTISDALPKTRSGKIMRRLLRDIASGVESKGDLSTLEDQQILANLRL